MIKLPQGNLSIPGFVPTDVMYDRVVIPQIGRNNCLSFRISSLHGYVIGVVPGHIQQLYMLMKQNVQHILVIIVQLIAVQRPADLFKGHKLAACGKIQQQHPCVEISIRPGQMT